MRLLPRTGWEILIIAILILFCLLLHLNGWIVFTLFVSYLAITGLVKAIIQLRDPESQTFLADAAAKRKSRREGEAILSNIFRPQ